jgi:LysM repeat protein
MLLSMTNNDVLKWDARSGATTVSQAYMQTREAEVPRFSIGEMQKKLLLPTYSLGSYFKKENPDTEVDAKEYLDILSNKYGLVKDVLFFQNHVESRGRCLNSISRAGARGCFQFLSSTAREFNILGEDYDYTANYYRSADAAARYLKWISLELYREESDLSDWEQLRHVLASYNAGYNIVRKSGKPRIPNFYETVSYVNDIENLVKGRATIVLPGESLLDISRRVNFPVNVIVRANPEVNGDDDLYAGNVISLPDENGYAKFVVKRGMSLRSIQNGTGVRVNDMVVTNGLKDPDLIRVASVLFIPTQSESVVQLPPDYMIR